MDALSIPLKPLTEGLHIPACAYEGDAGVDLCAASSVVLKPFERALVPCGFAIALPEGYAGFVLPRSGLASKHGVTVVNAPGLIDSGYRGEIKVALVNLDPENVFSVQVGDRIAQLVVMPVSTVQFRAVEDLADSERGAGGFGSSGISGAQG